MLEGWIVEIPDSVAQCQIVGRLLDIEFDGRDPAVQLQAVQDEQLTVEMTATIDRIPVDTPSALFRLKPFTVPTNQAGMVINPRSPDEPVMVPATSQPGVEDFEYLVRVTWGGRVLERLIQAPPGGVVDLAKMFPPGLPPINGGGRVWIGETEPDERVYSTWIDTGVAPARIREWES